MGVKMLLPRKGKSRLISHRRALMRGSPSGTLILGHSWIATLSNLTRKRRLEKSGSLPHVSLKEYFDNRD